MADGEEEPTPVEPGRFTALPARVDPKDMVQEVPPEDPPPDTAGDPNREVAWRWGLGIAPGG